MNDVREHKPVVIVRLHSMNANDLQWFVEHVDERQLPVVTERHNVLIVAQLILMEQMNDVKTLYYLPFLSLLIRSDLLKVKQ